MININAPAAEEEGVLWVADPPNVIMLSFSMYEGRCQMCPERKIYSTIPLNTKKKLKGKDRVLFP